MINLSEIGEIVINCWEKIPKHFSNVVVDTFQIMPRLSEPNHVHGIVTIRDRSPSPTVGIELEEPSACSTTTIA